MSDQTPKLDRSPEPCGFAAAQDDAKFAKLVRNPLGVAFGLFDFDGRGSSWMRSYPLVIVSGRLQLEVWPVYQLLGITWNTIDLRTDKEILGGEEYVLEWVAEPHFLFQKHRGRRVTSVVLHGSHIRDSEDLLDGIEFEFEGESLGIAADGDFIAIVDSPRWRSDRRFVQSRRTWSGLREGAFVPRGSSFGGAHRLWTHVCETCGGQFVLPLNTKHSIRCPHCYPVS